MGRGHERRLVSRWSSTNDHDARCHGIKPTSTDPTRLAIVGQPCRHLHHRTTRLAPVPLYAAYGSNMHPEQMLQRAPHSPMAGTGWLHGWRLTFGGEDIGWEGALATVVQDPHSRVFVVLYDMTGADETNLDRWEGSELGIHTKIRCRIDREIGRAHV